MNAAFTYNRTSGVRGQRHTLHPAARQQRHLQAEQVGRQAAGRHGDVEVHPGEDKTRELLRDEGGNQDVPLLSGHPFQVMLYKVGGGG